MSGHQQGETQRKSHGVGVIHEDIEQHMSPDRGRAIRH